MKFINSVFIICGIFLSMSFYGQSNDSLQKLNDTKSILHFSGISSQDQTFDFKNLNFHSDAPSLVLYNDTTNSYDTYLNYNGNYSYFGSSTIFRNKSNFLTNLFLGNDSFVESNSLLINNRFLLLDEDVSYMVRDSFNPNGASNFSEAVIGGVFGLLFN